VVVCALAAAAPASAAVRIEKTVVVRPAPHGGITPDGTLDPGESVQQTHVALPAGAADCDWALTDPKTGRMPGDPFPGQIWKLVFAGLVQKRDWALIVRVVNSKTESQREQPRHWRLVLRCTTPRHPPACSLHALRVPQPPDYLALGFHCRIASGRFKVTLPAGYGVRALVAADNSLRHEAMTCRSAGRVLSCRGRTPANTTTWLGFFLTKPVAPALRVTVVVPHARAARARTRRVDLRF
jgi:hypothetical protein